MTERLPYTVHVKDVPLHAPVAFRRIAAFDCERAAINYADECWRAHAFKIRYKVLWLGRWTKWDSHPHEDRNA